MLRSVWEKRRLLVWVVMLFCGLVLTSVHTQSGMAASLRQRPAQSDVIDEVPALNIRDRDGVTRFFRVRYQIESDVEIGWLGDAASCDAGFIAPGFVTAVERRINFYRLMAGLSPVKLDPVYSGKAQQAALLTARNGLNHNPPPSARCYSADAAQAAANSHLYIGRYGPAAIDGYIQDHDEGFHDNYHVGHRRWILLPQLRTLGTGDFPGTETLPAANALWVVDTSMRDPRPETRDGFVAWPPPGFVPYPVVYPRWSFSYPEADFSAAQVHMQVNGVEMTVEVEPLYEWKPTEPTLVWLPAGMDSRAAWPRPSQDTIYTVTITNVQAGGRWLSFSYDVTVFDPDRAAPPPHEGIAAPIPRPLSPLDRLPGPPFWAR